MKILFLSGVFAKDNEDEIIAHAKAPVEYSANRFQEKIINGFKEAKYDTSVLSAPFIGAYPMCSDIIYFKGFEKGQDNYRYVKFFNVWGIRNISRTRALKKSLRDFIKVEDDDKLIVVTSPHTPFVEAAVYAKKKDPKIRINLIVPDLPQYMNLKAKVSLVYKIAKKFDVARFNKLIKSVDGFTLLTKTMADKLNIGDKPYTVVEGVLESDIFSINEIKKAKMSKDNSTKLIVYTGKTDEKFGIKKLVDDFTLSEDIDYRLVICGRGDSDGYIKELAKTDTRIIALGQVTADVAQEWMLKADVLINPRLNDEEYTKYSFPSKNLEYLASGNAVVYYMLDGMKEIYRSFANIANDNLCTAIREAIENEDTLKRYQSFKDYARENLSAKNIACKIIATCIGAENEFSKQ